MTIIDWAGLANTVGIDEREIFLLSWADALEEQGLTGAHGLRWLAKEKRWPLNRIGVICWYQQFSGTSYGEDSWLPVWIGYSLLGTTTTGRVGELLLGAALACERTLEDTE